jgi:hypothetical protein
VEEEGIGKGNEANGEDKGRKNARGRRERRKKTTSGEGGPANGDGARTSAGLLTGDVETQKKAAQEKGNRPTAGRATGLRQAEPKQTDAGT